jgi:hypothetical protein
MKKTNKDFSMIIDNDFKIKHELDELKKRIAFLNRDILEIKKQGNADLLRQLEVVKANLNELEGSLSLTILNAENITNSLNALAQQVQELENSGGGEIDGLATVATTGDYLDLKIRPDEYFEMGYSFKARYHQVWGIDKNAFHTKNIWFTNAIDTDIEGVVKVGHQSSMRYTGVNEQIELMFNGEVIDSVSVTTLLPSELHKEFAFKIRPKKRLNNFSINLTRNDADSPARHYATYFTIEVTYGKNILFLNRDYNNQVSVYKNKYLITKNKHPNVSYFVKSKDDFDFTTGSMNLSQSFGKNLTMCCYSFYNSNSDYVDVNQEVFWFIGLDSNGEYPKVIIKTDNSIRKITTLEECHSYSYSYFREDTTLNECPSVCFILGQERRLVFWENNLNNEVSYKNFTLNGNLVETGVWLEVSAVIKQDMEGVNYRGFKGCVAMKFNGECTFFPHFNADYTLNLGFGRRVNAYYQDNGNIHVYMGRLNNVVKKVLVKNLETNRYEIDINQEVKIDGFDEVVETLDGYFIGITDSDIKLVPLT